MRLLHTSAVHVARFDALRDRLAPGHALTHILREDWLSRARATGLAADLEAEIAAEVLGPTLCTCTTLGPLAERVGALRIDRPMMRQAARIGGPVLLAHTVASTAGPSLALLHEEGATEVVALDLTHLWDLFEAGDLHSYATGIARAVWATVAREPAIATVVLAQASMDGAAPALGDLACPVLTPAESAFRALLQR